MPKYQLTLNATLSIDIPMVIEASDAEHAKMAAERALERLAEHHERYDTFLPEAFAEQWLKILDPPHIHEIGAAGRVPAVGSAAYWISDSFLSHDVEEIGI